MSCYVGDADLRALHDLLRRTRCWIDTTRIQTTKVWPGFGVTLHWLIKMWGETAREAWSVTALDVLQIQIQIFSAVGTKTKKFASTIQGDDIIIRGRLLMPESEFPKKLFIFICSPASFTLA